MSGRARFYRGEWWVFIAYRGHTFASLLIQNGESLAHVKEQLGHSSIQATVDVYGRFVPGGNRAAVDRLDAAPTCIRAEKCAIEKGG